MSLYTDFSLLLHSVFLNLGYSHLLFFFYFVLLLLLWGFVVVVVCLFLFVCCFFYFFFVKFIYSLFTLGDDIV